MDKKNKVTNDQKIVDNIQKVFEDKMQESAMDINVDCSNGVVQLTGIVDVLSEKIMAESLARNIYGVKKIENNITISTDSKITDKHIEKEILDRLRNSEESDRIVSVGVKVNDGVANLIGQVDTLKDAHTAMKLASQTRGVKDVVNNTEVSDAGLYDDVSINNRIRQEFNLSNLNSEDIVSDVIGGKVTLTGYVNSKKEAEIAKEIAMGVEGVTKVHNRLRIRK